MTAVELKGTGENVKLKILPIICHQRFLFHDQLGSFLFRQKWISNHICLILTRMSSILITRGKLLQFLNFITFAAQNVTASLILNKPL